MTPARPQQRGELRIYFGAAPGVGKTYAALAEARRRAERGTDVVVGLVETHGRAQTAALLAGLEVMPPRSLADQGGQVHEMDLNAMLARAPELIVVDELAHTNVPGSRNLKRWQDVAELLDAGISVLSTANVADLESLNDVVERITGMAQPETVPDEVVRAAEQIELVDITPQALRRRMAHGNIYPPEKVDAALGNYFRTGNLIALRELALLWVADEVDAALQRYRSQQHITEPWETRERVVVAVNDAPESKPVLRRAARIAKRAAGADLLCVHVLRREGANGAPPAALTTLRRLAEDLGASFHTVIGENVPTALLDFARGVNATELIIGTSRRSRLARMLDPGIGARAIADAGPIDVHLVTHPEAARGVRLPNRRSALPSGRRISGWLLGLLLPAVATGLGVAARLVLPLSTDVVVLLLAIVAVALVGGLGPALLAAAVGGLLLNFFLTPPLYTFIIADRANVITLSVMVVVAVLVAGVVDRAAHRGEQAAAARTEAALLASFARTVLTAADPLPRLLDRVREAFGLDSVAVLERTDRGWQVLSHTGPTDVAEFVGPDAPDVDVAAEPDIHLVARGHALAASDRRVLETVAGQALLALRAQRLAEQATAARRHAEATELRTALLSALGHDLRTPLTSIQAAIDGLRDDELELSPRDTDELLATIDESTVRLRGLVNNLLDSSRLATGAITPQLCATGYDETLAAALSGLADHHRVTVEVDDTLPDVLADPGLLDRVVANLVDNALRHGAGAPVAVRASAHAGRVELRVVDQGPGAPRHSLEMIFAPFQRLGDRDTTTGLGLGLAVARGFTEAMGGTLTVEDTPGGGLTAVLSLPAASCSTTAATP